MAFEVSVERSTFDKHQINVCVYDRYGDNPAHNASMSESEFIEMINEMLQEAKINIQIGQIYVMKVEND